MSPDLKVFLSYNSSDRAAVEKLAARLEAAGVSVWLDTWDLRPGDAWQPAIERALASCTVCAVCIGRQGIGPWQHEEMRAAINRRVRDPARFRAIPILLPGVEREEHLPAFLAGTMWVEFRSSVDEGEPFQRLLWGLGSTPLGRVPREAGPIPCPYRGLLSFEVEDAPFFFGREELTGRLLAKLLPGRRQNRFLAMVGASGSGKSSLARAGLLAALRKGGLDTSESWPPPVICRPGADPIERLGLALFDLAGLEVVSLARFLDELRRNPAALHLSVMAALRAAPESHRLVILVDQFEEVFTHCKDVDLRLRFIDALVRAATTEDGRTLVVLTLRAELLGECAVHPQLSALLSDHQVLIGPMEEKDLVRVLEMPARAVGCDLEPGLAGLLMRGVQGRPSGLPLLQVALLELWEQRRGPLLTVEAYERIGGVEGALQRRAERIVKDLNEQESEICRRIFLRLIDAGSDTPDLRRRVALQELLPAEGDRGPVEEVLRLLAGPEARLIVVETPHGKPDEPFVEIAHEALIRNWRRLQDWVAADREALRIRQRLTADAGDWSRTQDRSFLYRDLRLSRAEAWAAAHPAEPSGEERAFLAAAQEQRDRDLRDERQRQDRELSHARALAEEQRQRADVETRGRHRLRRLAAGLAAMVLLVAGAAGYALWSQREVWRQADLNLAQSLAYRSQLDLESSPEKSLLLGVEAVRLAKEAAERDEPASLEALLRALAHVGGAGLGGHAGVVTSLRFSSDSRWLATVSDGGTVSLRRLSAAAPDATSPPILEKPEHNCNASFLEPGMGLLVYCSERRIRLATSGEPEAVLHFWRLTARGPDPHPAILYAGKRLTRIEISSTGRRVLLESGKTGRLFFLDRSGPVRSRSLRLATSSKDAGFSFDDRWLVRSTATGASLLDLDAPKLSEVPLGQATIGGGPVAFSRDGRWVAVGNERHVGLWPLNSPLPAGGAIYPLQASPRPSPTSFLSFSADSRRLFWIDVDQFALHPSGSITWVVELPVGDPKEKPHGLGKLRRFAQPALSQKGRFLAAVSSGEALQVWDFTNPERAPWIASLPGDSVSSLAFLLDRWLVSGHRDGAVRLWDMEGSSQADPVFTLRGQVGAARAVAASPDGHWIASAGRGTARLWNMTRSGPPVHPFDRGKIGLGSDVAVSPGGWLTIRSRGQTVQVWDLPAEGLLERPVLSLELRLPVRRTAVSPDRRWLAIGGEEGALDLRLLKASRSAGKKLEGHLGNVDGLAFTPDGRRLVTACSAGRVLLWDLAPPQPRQLVLRPGEPGAKVDVALQISRGGHWLAARIGNDVLLWDLSVPRSSSSPFGRSLGSPDGLEFLAETLLVTIDGRFVALWSLASPETPLAINELNGSAGKIAASSSGRFFATGDGVAAELWEPRTGRDLSLARVKNLQCKERDGYTSGELALSPDERWLAMGGRDGRLCLWSLDRPAPQPLVIQAKGPSVASLTFSRDSSHLVSVDSVGSVMLWDLRVDELARLACRTAGRNLSREEWALYFGDRPYRKTCPELPFPLPPVRPASSGFG